MEVLISPADWRVLRQALRARRPPPGRTLRLDRSRRTRDGSFLTALIRRGLLRVVRPGETPFDSTYALTDRGRHAAEYGTFEVGLEEYRALRSEG